MFEKNALRYYTEDPLSASSETVLLPVSIHSSGRSHESALKIVREVVGRLCQHVDGHEVDASSFGLLSFDKDSSGKRATLQFSLTGKKYQCRMLALVELKFRSESGFWTKMRAVARALDILDEFYGQYSGSKDVSVTSGRVDADLIKYAAVKKV